MYWYNGQVCSGERLEVGVGDPGFLYGATTFTTLRVYEGGLLDPRTAWGEHLQRLQGAIAALGWMAPDWQMLETGARCLAAEFVVLRVTLFADGRVLITGRSLPQDLQRRQQEGVVALLARGPRFARWWPQQKTGNYLGPWLALQEARQLGAVEAILVDDGGQWLETATGTLWGWGEGRWWTPPLSAGILPGIGRSRLLGLARRQGWEVVEQPWCPSLVGRFEGLAYSNAVVELVPIRQVLRSPGPDQEMETKRYHGGRGAMAELRSLLKSL
ncbi:aminotransferase class IV [Phormidium yuhuli AB48]|uniref:Aminotransferase class IV n=1 Tax=Phormidium yuhuli AB48 TaxID=2940671 RepID=A0ABY5ASB1_9CYAN|nr:aminotransferase class IV [Phormidium yuhuli]USR92112.1 aminotransferase class IV [Phormidium yuhuli AB48]